MTKKKINIYFFTGKRGGFSHLIPILRLIEKDKKFKYKILAADMHLSNTFGNTIKEIKKYTKNILKVKSFNISDSEKNRLRVISKTIESLAKIFSKKKPDYIFLIGDRAEVHSAAITSLHFNVPIIHLYGGDITQGGTDEPTRHAITKISNIHFTSTIDSFRNVIRMGEEKWRVHNVGLSSLDLFQKNYFRSKNYLQKKFNLNFSEPFAILIQHSVTWQVKESKKQILETLKSLKKLKIQTVAMYPCSDPGFKDIVKSLNKFKKNKYFKLFKNIDSNDFYSLLKHCSFVIGNSSCGITECGFFNKPVINIGIRQEGRVTGPNVLNVSHNSTRISNLINQILSKNFKFKSNTKLYGTGNASKKILKILKKLPKKEKIIKKKFI
tara:strand:- start:3065 stop:4210 length:1146 start_codon:yes stop_codon:yes gene_type:complete